MYGTVAQLRLKKDAVLGFKEINDSDQSNQSVISNSYSAGVQIMAQSINWLFSNCSQVNTKKVGLQIAFHCGEVEALV